MSARDRILAAVRAARPPAVALPHVAAVAAAFPSPPGDLAVRYADAARASGARVVEGTRDALAQLVAAAYPDARRIVSTIGAVAGTVPLPDDPRALGGVDLFVCEAVLGVAENGALWLPGSRLGARAALFLAASVVVALQRTAVVGNLHDAYARLDVAAEPFGLFVAGPSKTADIEQSLVVGAHGPRSLTLLLLA